jgi:hypothetical protein
MSKLHHRMPIIMEPSAWPVCRGEEKGEPTDLLRPARDGAVLLWCVSRAVNNVRNNGPELLDGMTIRMRRGRAVRRPGRIQRNSGYLLLRLKIPHLIHKDNVSIATLCAISRGILAALVVSYSAVASSGVCSLISPFGREGDTSPSALRVTPVGGPSSLKSLIFSVGLEHNQGLRPSPADRMRAAYLFARPFGQVEC